MNRDARRRAPLLRVPLEVGDSDWPKKLRPPTPACPHRDTTTRRRASSCFRRKEFKDCPGRGSGNMPRRHSSRARSLQSLRSCAAVRIVMRSLHMCGALLRALLCVCVFTLKENSSFRGREQGPFGRVCGLRRPRTKVERTPLQGRASGNWSLRTARVARGFVPCRLRFHTPDH